MNGITLIKWITDKHCAFLEDDRRDFACIEIVGLTRGPQYRVSIVSFDTYNYVVLLYFISYRYSSSRFLIFSRPVEPPRGTKSQQNRNFINVILRWIYVVISVGTYTVYTYIYTVYPLWFYTAPAAPPVTSSRHHPATAAETMDVCRR